MMQTAGKKIGTYVRYQREKRQLSLRAYATITDLTPSYLSRLESGEYHNVTFSVIEKLAKGFQMPVPEFMKKCQITEEHHSPLPDIDFYLREKYQLPTAAVEDMSMFFRFIKEKYHTDIDDLQKKHRKYWKPS